MSQRASGYERKTLDLYDTPAWVTAALLPHLPGVKAVMGASRRPPYMLARGVHRARPAPHASAWPGSHAPAHGL